MFTDTCNMTKVAAGVENPAGMIDLVICICDRHCNTVAATFMAWNG